VAADGKTDTADIKAQINAKLAPLGMTFDQLIPVFQPMVTAAVKEVLAEMKLPEMLNASVVKGVDARMVSFAEEIQKRTAGTEVIQPSAPGVAPVGPGQPPAAGGFNLSQVLSNPAMLPVILQALGLGPKPAGELAGLEQLAGFAKAFGAINQAFVTPILEAQESGRRTALAQIGALAKTGSKMPWEVSDGKPI